MFAVPFQKVRGKVQDQAFIGGCEIHLRAVDLSAVHQHDVPGTEGIGTAFNCIYYISFQMHQDFEEIMIVEIIGALQSVFDVEQMEVAFQITLLLGVRGAVAYIHGCSSFWEAFYGYRPAETVLQEQYIRIIALFAI